MCRRSSYGNGEKNGPWSLIWPTASKSMMDPKPKHSRTDLKYDPNKMAVDFMSIGKVLLADHLACIVIEARPTEKS